MRSFQLRPSQAYVSPRHWHDWDQLTLAIAGTTRVHASADSWLVPPGRAIWIPARTRHLERVDAGASAHTLYLGAGLARSLTRQCGVVDAPPLLRELVAHIGRVGELDRRTAAHARLTGLLVDLLSALAPAPPLRLPEPRDPRACHVAGVLRERPDTAAPVSALARQAGASTRTIERLFLAETAMTIGDWRRRLRLLHAVERLTSGTSVAAAARGAGYASPSAFIAVFRKTFGMTPRRFTA